MGRWSISLRINVTRDLTLTHIKKQIGIHFRIISLLTTNDGEKVANPKNLNKLHKKFGIKTLSA